MTSALLPQCARPLLVVVVSVLLLCCCRPADAQQPDLKNFTCAKTGANLPDGLTIPMDNQIRIDARKRAEDQQQLHVLLLNTTDEKPKMTLVAGPSCQIAFSPASVNSSTCVVGKANNVSQKHAPSKCPDADGCKEFNFNCTMARDANLSANVFKINLKDFQPIDEQQCKGRAYIYIDNVRLLMRGPMSNMVEKCPAEGSKKATNGITEATTTNSANTTTTGSTETTTTGSTKTTTTGSTETTTTGSTKTTTTGSTETTTTNSADTATTGRTDTTTTSSADTTTTNSSNTTTTNSSNTTTTESTEMMGSTETTFMKDGTMIIILSVLGAGLFIAVVAAVVCVLCRRKGTSEDAAALEVEEDEKSAAATTPTKAPSPKTEGVEVPDSAYSKASQDEDGSTAVDGSTTA